MAKTRTSFLLSFVLILLASASAVTQQRELQYSKGGSGKLQEISRKIRDLKSAITPADQLTRKTEYFVRIAPRKYIIAENGKLKDEATLGVRPFVFVTTVESVFGLSLLDIYLGIGYEAEDIIRWQRDEDMVMIVFKYPPEIVTTEVTNGQLPEGWDQKVYDPTWENMFSLFQRLASVDAQKVLAPERTLVMTPEERDFALGFPAERKQTIKQTGYAALKAAGGLNWRYRSLLESKLSLFEHFRGTGQAQNEVRDPDGVKPGLIEFVGPNWKVTDLPEVAIIHLGKLTMKDSYGGGCALCGSGN